MSEENKKRQKRPDFLPLSCPPRGLSREQVAQYIGVSVTLFLELVGDGRMPKPKKINGRVVWDKLKVDAAFDQLPGDGDPVDDQWTAKV